MSIAPKLRQYLDSRHADYDIIAHDPTKSAMQSAQLCHVPAGQLAKGVLLDTADGYLLAVLPANHKIQLGDMTAEFGQRPHLVEEDRLENIFTDCAMGAVPPLGGSYGLATMVDDSLDEQADIYFEAGDHQSLVHMSRGEFMRLTEPARHGSFSAHWSMVN